MKKTYLTLFLLSIIALGCKSDDDDDDSSNDSNFLKIANKEYDLKEGLAVDYAKQSTDFYNIDLNLVTDGYTINGQDIEGTGLGIYFEAYSSTSKKLAVGTYQYNQTEAPLSFDAAHIFVEDENDDDYINLTDGTLTITKSMKDYYELTFKGVDEDDRTITGRFHGEINYHLHIEDSDEKRSKK